MHDHHLHSAAPILDAILDQLRQHPAGISEYQLLGALEQQGEHGFERAALADPVRLFRTHFILFHYLYRLRERLRPGGEELEIHCLRIVLRPAAAGAPGAVDKLDPLARYYLDLSNLEGVDAAEVERLLSGFWRRYAHRDGRAQALAVLGLEDPVDGVQIKRRYRRLAMEHHPDRGGDKQTLQRLNAAMALLTQR